MSPEAERRVRFGHPWLYAEGIARQSRPGVSGDLAVIYDRRDRFLALGLYDPSSPIRVRILQRHAPAAIDAAWLGERIAASVKRRQALVESRETTGYRLVHGENDGLPGLVIDRYDQTLVLKLYTGAWAAHLGALREALDAVVQSQRIVLRVSRAVRASGSARQALDHGAVLKGRPMAHALAFLERGLTFEADVLRGQKTGFFLDQRDNRAKVESFSRGRRVLDVFAYTGAFTVAAARGGAREVTSIEGRRAALEAAKRHMVLNRTHPAVARARHRVIVANAFEALERLAERRGRFDLVVLDPPSFANAHAQVPAALVAYQRLTRLGLGVLEPEGILVITSCSGQVSDDAFFAAVHRAARQARRPLRELARTGQPPDHPVGFREGAYLKGLFAVAKRAVGRRARGSGTVRRTP